MTIEKSARERKTRCFCPKCEKYHDMALFWTGRGVPRKFCHHCKSEENNYYERKEKNYYAKPRVLESNINQ